MPAPIKNPGSAENTLIAHNREAWNRQASTDCEWSRPVSTEELAAARQPFPESGRKPPGLLLIILEPVEELAILGQPV